MKHILLSFVVCLFALNIHATIRLPQFFSDGMVLQQQTEVRLWGWCEQNGKKINNKNVTVTTSWNKMSYTTQTDTNGRFEISVQTPKAGGPYHISFQEKATRNTSSTTNLTNVLIGEVWLCSGQSNMEMQMKGFKGQPVEGATEELLACGDSLLRLYTGKRNPQLQPVDDIAATWQLANTASVREFSATAYYFGKALRKALGVPVGLICTSFGGSACEAWMKADWLQAFPKVTLPTTEDDVKRLQQRCPTALYNGQLHPLIGYGIRGAIWYQGEDNIPRYDFYAPLMTRMIQGWREEWKQGDFPFYYFNPSNS